MPPLIINGNSYKNPLLLCNKGSHHLLVYYCINTECIAECIALSMYAPLVASYQIALTKLGSLSLHFNTAIKVKATGPQ